jgi:hypothetical protein
MKKPKTVTLSVAVYPRQKKLLAMLARDHWRNSKLVLNTSEVVRQLIEDAARGIK